MIKTFLIISGSFLVACNNHSNTQNTAPHVDTNLLKNKQNNSDSMVASPKNPDTVNYMKTQQDQTDIRKRK